MHVLVRQSSVIFYLKLFSLDLREPDQLAFELTTWKMFIPRMRPKDSYLQNYAHINIFYAVLPLFIPIWSFASFRSELAERCDISVVRTASESDCTRISPGPPAYLCHPHFPVPARSTHRIWKDFLFSFSSLLRDGSDNAMVAQPRNRESILYRHRKFSPD
jgi:hypothetical protein